MPVGKPTPDGEITMGSRHYGGKARLSAPLAPWECPACGKVNEGRKPEQGCGICGSGDPSKGTAGTVERPRVEEPVAAVRETSRVVRSVPRQGDVEPHPTQPLRILRLIEYLIPAGCDAQETLRRSLVGTLELGGVQITGTIVDSLNDRQEDLLGLARKQPGVWLGNPIAMEGQQSDARPAPNWLPQAEAAARLSNGPGFKAVQQLMREGMQHWEREIMKQPDTGPAWTARDGLIANHLVHEFGVKLVHTLALALSSIAEELAGNSEPEKFLTQQECLQLANALMHEVPDDWQGDLPPADPQDENAILEEKLRDADQQ